MNSAGYAYFGMIAVVGFIMGMEKLNESDQVISSTLAAFTFISGCIIAFFKLKRLLGFGVMSAGSGAGLVLVLENIGYGHWLSIAMLVMAISSLILYAGAILKSK